MFTYEIQKIESKLEWLGARRQGVGTSELDQMCGQSPFGTTAELWQLKTGLVPPTKENEDMRRGHELEPRVRDAIMALVGDDMELEYHEYWIYSTTELSMVFATLDGILTAKRNFTLSLSGQSMPFRKGEKAILEIKNPKPRTLATYNAWDELPKHYRYQNAGQMICTGIRKHIEVANLTGDFASPNSDGMDLRVFLSEYGDYLKEVEEIKKTAPIFWEKVVSRQPAPVAIEGYEGQIITFESTVNAGSIIDNFDSVRASVQAYADSFKGLTFTEEEEKKAKDFRADLNKQINTIESVRKSVKKTWEEPLKLFEDKCKELTSIIRNVEAPIAEQVATFETKRKAEKEEQVKAMIDAVLQKNRESLRDMIERSGGIAIDPKWLNKSTSMKTIQQDIANIFGSIEQDFGVVTRLRHSAETEQEAEIILMEYINSGRNLSAAMAKADEYKAFHQAEIDREVKRLEALAEEKKRQEQEEIQVAEEQKVEEPQNVEPPVEEPKIQEKAPKTYRFVVEFSHTNKDEVVAFSKYLKSHGFAFKNVTAEYDAYLNN